MPVHTESSTSQKPTASCTKQRQSPRQWRGLLGQEREGVPKLPQTPQNINGYWENREIFYLKEQVLRVFIKIYLPFERVAGTALSTE